MNENEHISRSELRELETTLARFDSFKHDLVPNPDALRAALTKLPTNIPISQPQTRRITRARHVIAFVCASTLALTLLLHPHTNTLSPLASDMLAEEQTIDASFSYAADDDSESLDDADATLASLTGDSVL